MSYQQTSIMRSALGWVKKSIDDNLSEIETDIKLYIEEKDLPLLNSVKQRLEMIRGVLMMVEQYGAAMLAEEMLSLCDFIIDRKKDTTDQSLEVLLRAVLQLPDYLEHIQSGNRDIPIAILPLLNDIRAVRNQDLFSEKLLFLPDLSMHTESAETDSIDDRSNQASRLLAKKLRPIYQYGLLNIIRENSVEENLRRIEKVCETLEERSYTEQVARIWWIIGALIESVSRQQLELGVSVKNLLGKVDALFRVILIIGEAGLQKRQPVELIKNFLYYVAQPECDGPKTQAIKTAYRLEQFLPSEASRSKVLDNIAGPNQALLKAVAEAMKVDLETVKSTLEVYVNGDLSELELLKDVPKELHVISDTLAMIGLGPQRQLIESQIVVVKNILDGQYPGSEDKLLSMAAELLQVEQALDVMQKRQSVDDERESSESDLSKEYEMESVLFAVVTAALDNIQKTKTAILEFVKDSTHRENMDLCVALMGESRGALVLLNYPRAVAVVDGLIEYLKGYDIARFTDPSRLDALSQVVVSIEYFFEALAEKQNDADYILDFADTHLGELHSGLVVDSDPSDPPRADPQSEVGEGFEPAVDLPQIEDLNLDSELSSEPDTEAMPVVSDGIEVEFAEDSSEPGLADSEPTEDNKSAGADLDRDKEVLHEVLDVTSRGISAFENDANAEYLGKAVVVDRPLQVVPVTEEAEVLVPGSDPDILEIYLEEAEEEAANVNRMQADWLLHPEDANALKNIRRTFHTIKGSGRLVGALKIGEFAWDYEQLLNQVIDKTILPSDEVIDAVGQASVALTQLVTELKGGESPSVDIPYLRGLARALAEFKAEQVFSERAGIQAIDTESPYDRITETVAAIQVADEQFDSSPESSLDDTGGFNKPGTAVLDSGGIEVETSELSLDTGTGLTGNNVADDGQSIRAGQPAAVDGETANMVSDTDAGTGAPPTEDPPGPFVATTKIPMPGKEAGKGVPRTQELDEATDLWFAPELLTIYQQEVEQHLNTINSALEYSEKVKELVPSEDFYRALHTIHGASRTADIGSIAELAKLLEKPLKSALAQSMALDHEIVALYRSAHQALQSMTLELVDTRRVPQIPEDLKLSLEALAEDLEEHTVEITEGVDQASDEFVNTLTLISNSVDSEQDDELLTIFVDEAKELLEMSDHTLHDWAKQEVDANGLPDYTAVMELQRYLHTLKGGAKMAELKEIGDLSHELESMFIEVIDNQVEKNEDLIEILRDSFDLLYRQVIEAEEMQPLSKSADQVKLLREMRHLDSDNQAEAVVAGDSKLASENINIVDENFLTEADRDPGRQTQEVIKVRSDLLDNLVNSAGEVSIYRARMEQQVSGLGSYLGELGQTISRLKNQLRNLESETDAQIHFGQRIDEKPPGDFDPLELDRYTVIQELSRSLSESVDDLSSLQGLLGDQVKDSETLLLQQSRVNTDLQDGLIKSRMVKFSGLLSRLRRLVRQSSQELGRKAELVITGEENEVDNKVLDRIVSPLEHIIRNAVSHGIEDPVERINKGKPGTGVISVDISRDGSDIVIKVSDDGAGISLDKVRGRALQLGLLEKAHAISDNDLIQFILEPGFSTAEHVTQLSGRGVGMDVVDIEIKQLGGSLQIETGPWGSTFIARLPFTLSINQAILVRTGEESYALPLINIEGITRLETGKLIEYYQQDEPEIEYAGQQFKLHNLSELVGASAHINGEADQLKQPVILSRSGDVRVALHVDEVLGNREIVVKALGKQLSQVKGLSGASILADGSVVLILDVNSILRQSKASPVKIVYRSELKDVVAGGERQKTVMVVDDSITMRRVASKLLERHKYTVVTAKDGVDALAQLEDVRPDVMLLDIEMPRMDGFELATHMQNESSYSSIPIIMITSRTGEKHMDRALEIGVANYMGKPYQEEELIANIQDAIAG
jgi:chemosensory pili system protein ChpA (sensor histidine kinase/response regulator)